MNQDEQKQVGTASCCGSHHDHTKTPENRSAASGSSSNRHGFLILIFLVIAGLLWVTGHGNHLLRLLSYMFLLACPLMHLFHRHGKHRSHDHQENNPTQTS